MNILKIIVNKLLNYLNTFRYILFKLENKLVKNVDIMHGAIVSRDSVIGFNTYIGHYSIISKVILGNYCSIAPNVLIGLGEHDLNTISTNSIFYNTPYKKLTKKDCIIGNDVWIGAGSIIRRGVKIGNGSVIGANSFVNKDVEPYSVVAGNPAKIIKYRFSESKIKEIELSEWWNLQKEEARKVFNEIK